MLIKHKRPYIILCFSVFILSIIGLTTQKSILNVAQYNTEISLYMSLSTAISFMVITLLCLYLKLTNFFEQPLVTNNLTSNTVNSDKNNHLITIIFNMIIVLFIILNVSDIIQHFTKSTLLHTLFNDDISTKINFLLLSWSLLIILGIKQSKSKISLIIHFSKEIALFILLFANIIFLLALLHHEPIFPNTKYILPLSLTSALAFICSAIVIIMLDQNNIFHQLFSTKNPSGYLIRFIVPMVMFSIFLSGLADNYGLRHVKLASIALVSGLLMATMSIIAAAIAIYVSRQMLKQQDKNTLVLKQKNTDLLNSQNNLKQYKKIVSCNSDVQALISKDFIYQLANNAYLNMFNITLDKLIGLTPNDILGAELFENKLKPLAQQCMLNNKIVQTSMWITTHDGDKYFNITYNPYKSEQDDCIKGFVVTARDITPSKKNQDKLIENNNLIQNILNSSPDHIFTKNTQLKFTLANNSFLRCMDKSVDEVIGFTDSEIGCTDDDILGSDINNSTGYIEADKKVLQGQSFTESGYRDSQGKIYDVIKIPLTSSSGKITGILGIAHDITEQVISLKKITTQRQELHQILDNMLDGVITIDETGKILTVNKATENLFGYKNTELIGQPFSMLMPESTSKQHDECLKNYIITGKSNIIGIGREVQALKKNNDIFTLHLSASELPLDDNGKQRFIGICHDLTLIKQQNEMLNRSQKLQALGQLTGGIAHDYNNMLGVILGYSEILQKQLNNHPTLANYIQQILKAGQRGTTLTQKLLSFSKPNDTTRLQPIILNEALLNLKDILCKSLTVLIDLQFNLAPNLWSVNIDNHGFDDMVLNICINALHAINLKHSAQSAHGKLIISTTNITLSVNKADNLALKPNDYVVLTIEDNGCGMSKDTQNQLFDPFFTTDKTQGTGLGLSQVYGFVNSANGAIKVLSTLKKGSTFTIYLPRSIAEKTRVNDSLNTLNDLPTNNNSKTINKTILVVDDEKQLKDLATEILSDEGYLVVNAENGKQALLELEKQPIDLLLTDIIMPELNGYQLIKKVEQLYPQLKIIIVSGFQSKPQQEKNQLQNDYPLINKPYNTKTLLSTVDQTFATERLINTNTINDITQKKTSAQAYFTNKMTIDSNGIIDKDHQYLFEILQQCQQLQDSDPLFSEKLQRLKDKMAHYTIDHFKREEIVMEICNYPYVNNHKKIHKMMVKSLSDVINNKSDLEIKNWLSQYLFNWLTDHIMVMDRAFKPYIKNKNKEIQQALKNYNVQQEKSNEYKI